MRTSPPLPCLTTRRCRSFYLRYTVESLNNVHLYNFNGFNGFNKYTIPYHTITAIRQLRPKQKTCPIFFFLKLYKIIPSITVIHQIRPFASYNHFCYSRLMKNPSITAKNVQTELSDLYILMCKVKL